jgi:hypothetical protein
MPCRPRPVKAPLRRVQAMSDPSARLRFQEDGDGDQGSAWGEDAALVFRADGVLEAVIPLLPEDADAPPNVMAAHALMWAYGHERMMETIAGAIDGAPEIVRDA